MRKIIITSESKQSIKKSRKRKYPFVVVNTDKFHGKYVKELAREVKEYNELTKLPGTLKLKHIQQNQIIVFGDVKCGKYSYRVVNEQQTQDNLNFIDERKLKVFNLVEDFDEIIDQLEKYVEKNNTYYKPPIRNWLSDRFCKPTLRKRPIYNKPREVIIEVEIPRYKTYVPKKKKPVLFYEDVKVHHNWVRVGWNQFDIKQNDNCERYIKTPQGKFYVEEDSYGQGYLVV